MMDRQIREMLNNLNENRQLEKRIDKTADKIAKRLMKDEQKLDELGIDLSGIDKLDRLKVMKAVVIRGIDGYIYTSDRNKSDNRPHKDSLENVIKRTMRIVGDAEDIVNDTGAYRKFAQPDSVMSRLKSVMRMNYGKRKAEEWGLYEIATEIIIEWAKAFDRELDLFEEIDEELDKRGYSYGQ